MPKREGTRSRQRSGMNQTWNEGNKTNLQVLFYPAPQLPYKWESALWKEEKKKKLFASDQINEQRHICLGIYSSGKNETMPKRNYLFSSLWVNLKPPNSKREMVYDDVYLSCQLSKQFLEKACLIMIIRLVLIIIIMHINRSLLPLITVNNMIKLYWNTFVISILILPKTCVARDYMSLTNGGGWVSWGSEMFP